MSNKKRISKKARAIQDKEKWKKLSFMCSWMVECIKAAQQMRISLRNISTHYPSGGFIPNNGELENIKNASQKIIKENPNYNKFTIKDKDLGSATFNIYKQS